jgi:hypothetical protein
MAGGRDAAQLLGIQVQQLAGPGPPVVHVPGRCPRRSRLSVA